jgi:pyruvate dehydrogenase E2 component (dihydrolipoamide acetyltransferase)
VVEIPPVATDFTLPELGESISAGDVLRILVKPGDTLAKDQTVLELETDKATIEVPSSVAGQVKEIKVKVGDKVKVGQAILSVEGGESTAAASPEPRSAPAPAQPVGEPRPAAAVGANTGSIAVDEPGLEQHAEGERRPTPDKPGTIASGQAAPAPSMPSGKVVDINRGARASAEPAAPELPVAPAAPSVRRMARELGVDINQVGGSGPSGRISVDDVKAHAKRLVSGTGSGAGTAAAIAAEPLPDFSRWGEVERQPMRAVRRKTAEHLSAAWATIPHVTQHDLADVTALE